jgi:SAM-dependent methyltransferase
VRYPWIPVIDADATDLPIADAVADAVTMLDIVEHLDRPEAALNEAHRVLRAGGVLIVSVPHRGLLERLDALNLYERLRRHRPQWRPLAPATTSGGHEHRHYTLPELEALLAPGFAVDRVARTGTGVQELISLALIAIAPRVPPALARILALGHLAVYVLDDLLPLGRKSYHLMVRARRVGDVRS